MKIEEAIKQKRFGSDQEKAWINLAYTFNFLSSQLNDCFKQFEITPQQFNVLRILRGRHPQFANCAEVKEVMIDKNPDLTRLCDRLVAKELIERELMTGNRRQVGLRISDKGIDLLKTVDPVLKNNLTFFGNLTDSEAQTLSSLLDKFRG